MSGSQSTNYKLKEHDEKFVELSREILRVKENQSEKFNPLKDSMIRDLRATSKYTEKELEEFF